MSNVIAYPKPVNETSRRPHATGAKTLFIHIKSTTFIAHLAAPTMAQVAGGRVGKTF